jgi:acrylyl-CoA reductase (NADPH)
MTAPFRAFVVNQTADGFQMGIQWIEQRDLPPGDVLIQVAYAALNYKDALVCIPKGGVARTYPLIPGLELTGMVVESSEARFQPGDAVLAFDFGSTQGISRHGGYSEFARVPADFLFPLPADVDCKQALVLSAGVTAAKGLRHLEKNELTPERGPVLVTGATGGVGSIAVSLLAKRGYTVAASTGKPDAQDYLRRLGASEILSREETSAESTRPLESERWAGSIDTVGGATLAYLMRTTKKGGAIAAIGVSGGAAFRATVYPLILRGVKVLGIDMPSTPLHMRRELWEEVIGETTLLSLVDAIVSEVTLEDIPRVTQAMLGGQTRGRILVRPMSSDSEYQARQVILQERKNV